MPHPKPMDVEGTPGEIQCKTAAGGGSDLSVIVQIGGQESVPVRGATLSYAVPVLTGISAVRTKDATSNTGDNVIIHAIGINFGPPPLAKVFFDGVPITFVSQNSHTEMTFQAPPAAVGSLKSIKVDVAGQESNTLDFSFNPPVVEQILPMSNIIGELEILGTSFGSSNETGAVRIDDTKCRILSWTHNRIACVAQKASGDFTIEVGGQLSEPIRNFDVNSVIPEYDPRIESLSLNEGSASGGYEITVFGSNLGPNDDFSTEIFFGSKMCVKPASNVTIDFATEITCIVPRSSGTVSVMAISGPKTSKPLNFSYITPNIESIFGTGAATFGGYKMTITGTNFGESGMLLWNGKTTVANAGKVIRTDASRITPENTKILCQSGCTSKSFAEPCSTTFCTGCRYAIQSFCALGVNDRLCQECMQSNEVNFVSGCVDSVHAVLAQCQDPLLPGYSDVVVQTYSDNLVEFVLPHGQGSNNTVEIEVAGKVFSNKVTFAYDPPLIQALSTNAGITDGNTLIMLHGQNFGETKYVMIGTFPCQILSSTHDKISCLTSPGEGAKLPVIVVAGDQVSPHMSYSYEPPRLKDVYPKEGLTSGNYSVTISGANFGLEAAVYIEGTICPRLSQNHTHITCKIPRGEGVNHNMYMIVGGQRSNNITWNYQLPKVRVVTPNPIDAISGGDVIIEGSNFGIEENDIEIYVGNYSCSDPKREVDPESKDPKFTCRLSNINARVGYTSVYVRASKQIIYIDAQEKMMAFTCPFNTFGRDGERCTICPVGAYCAGGSAEPIALPGFWKLSRKTFVSCLPQAACLGNNTCANGYEDGVAFCAKCDDGSYRVDLSCHPCTQMATFKLVAFTFAVIVLVLCVLNLSAFELKLATVNILIDFVQVIALCSAFFLDWTKWAKLIIEGSRVVLFNVENTEPECLNPEWTYESGYWLLETLPITFLVALWFFSHIYHFYKGCCRCKDKRQKKKVKQSKKVDDAVKSSEIQDAQPTHTRTEAARGYENTLRYVPMWRRGISDHAWGAYFLLCYYLFFPLSWKAWEPWDCSPYVISNTTTIYTMDADPTEQCYHSEHSTYWNRLGPLSLGFGVFYTLALPLYMAWIFIMYKKPIQKDQIRREKGGTEGQSWRKDLAAIRLQTQVRGHNARRDYGTGRFYARHQESHSTILVRKHYGKLYEDFKPNLYFWRLVQMGRKTALVFTIFVPSTAPSFQASLALLILFFAFVLQVKYRPYMKRNSFPEELETAGKQKVRSLGTRKTKVKPESDAVRLEKSRIARGRWKKAMLVARTEARWHQATTNHARDALEWLFDYNSMEMLSLASGIIILLFGLMMKTYSPSTTVLRYVSDSENISYYVRLALDRGTVGLFFFPITLLLSSLILDIHRNVTYYKNHKNMEKMQLERGKMKADAANTADHIREWRLKEEKKMEDEITILTAEHDKDILRITTLYNTKHDELEGNLKQEMVRRVEIEELIHKLSMQTPEDSSDSKRITKQLKDLNQQRKEVVNRIDNMNDELTELTVQYRNNKMHIHEKLEKTKREKRAKLKQRLDKRLREQDRRLKRKYRKTYDKNMPVKMQCRVLVTKNKFDQAYAQHGSHMATERLLTNRLKNSKSGIFEEHKKVMDKLQDNHVQSKQSMIDDHEEMIG